MTVEEVLEKRNYLNVSCKLGSILYRKIGKFQIKERERDQSKQYICCLSTLMEIYPFLFQTCKMLFRCHLPEPFSVPQAPCSFFPGSLLTTSENISCHKYYELLCSICFQYDNNTSINLPISEVHSKYSSHFSKE